MRLLSFIIVVVLVLIQPAAVVFAKNIQTHPEKTVHFSSSNTLEKPAYVEGEVLVKFKEESLDVSRFTGRVALKSFEIGRRVVRKDMIESQNITVMKGKSGESTVELINRLKKDPRVEYVEPNYLYYPEGVPNDTEFQKLWGLHNTGQTVNGKTGSADADIDAPEAWDVFTGSNVVTSSAASDAHVGDAEVTTEVMSGEEVASDKEGRETGVKTDAVTGGGKLAVAVDSSLSPSILLDGTAFNPVAKFTFSASSGNVNLKGLTITKTGSVGDTPVKLSVWKDGVRYGSVMPVSSDHTSVIDFTATPIAILDGSSASIVVSINLLASINSGTVGVSLAVKEHVSSDAADVTGAPVSGPNFQITDGASSVAAATLDVRVLRAVMAAVDIGQKNFEMTKFELAETSSKEDMKLLGLTIFNNGSAVDGDMTNLTLKDSDGVVLATVQRTSNKSAIFTLEKPYLVPRGTTRVLSVFIDIENGPTRTGQFVVQNDFDVQLEGTSTVAKIVPTTKAGGTDTSFPIGDTTTTMNGISINEGYITITKDDTSPSGDMIKGASTVVLARFRVQAVGEPIRIEKAVIDLSRGSVATSVSNTTGQFDCASTATCDLTGSIRLQTQSGKTLLTIGADTAAPWNGNNSSPWSSTYADFSSFHTINAGTTEILEIVGNLSSGANLGAGETIRADITKLYFYKTLSIKYAESGAASGNVLTAASSNLTVSVIVAVIDTGVNYNHPDLKNNMWNGSGTCRDHNNNVITGGCPNHGWDYGSSENGDNNPADYSGHGTHVAGTIGAVENNKKGIAGVSQAVNIMALKVADNNGGLSSASIVKAINFAKNNGAKIINASFGSYEESVSMKAAIAAFPGLFMASAGNDGINTDTTPHYPSSTNLSNIISVAWSIQNDTLDPASNYGPTSVDVAAPGGNIYSTYLVQPFSENFSSVTPPDIGTKFTKGGTTTNNWGTQGGVVWTDLENTPYANNANTSITSTTINLTQKDSAGLLFEIFCDTDLTTNFFADYIAVDIVSGASSTELEKLDEDMIQSLGGKSGSGGYFMERQIDISSFIGSQIRIRFRWVTDGSNQISGNYAGCNLDDILIQTSERNTENYVFLQGTSMASPHVSGLGAMIFGYNSLLPLDQVRTVIESTGDTKSALNGKVVTGKRINLFNALIFFQPVGGYDSANAIPAAQITQSTAGDGVMTIKFRLKDSMAGLKMTLNFFHYSVNGGSSFAAAQNGDNSGALSSTWKDNNYVSATDLAGPVYSFTWNTRNADLTGLNTLDQNDVIIRFLINDGARNSAAVTSAQFRVNNVIPAATLSGTPAAQTTVKTTDITVGGTNVITYQLSVDGAAYGNDTAIASKIQLSNLADGNHTIAVKGKDAQGNAQSNANTFTWLVDSTAPSGTITNASGNPTNDPTPTLNFTLSDSGVGTTGAKTRLSCDNSTWTSFAAYQAAVTNFDVKSGQNGCSTSDGTKRISAQFQDSLGNTSASVNTGDFVMDTSAAVAQLSTLPSNPTTQKTAEITVGGTNIVLYKWKLDSGNFSSETNVSTKISLSDLADGSHTLSVIGKNNAGTSQSESSATTFIWLVDTIGPTGTITNASGNPTNDSTPTLNFTISDSGVGITGAKTRLSCDNSTWTNFAAYQASVTDFDVKSGQNGCSAADGTKRVYGQFQDSLVNTGASVNTGDFVLNTASAFSQFTATPTNPSNQKTAEFTIGGTNIVSYKFKLDGGNFSSEANVSTKIQLSDLVDGSHTVSVVGKNNAGTLQAESSATTFTWLIDTTGPTGTITNASGNPTNDTTPSLNFTINDSGVGTTGAKTRLSCDNSTWTNFAAYQASVTDFNIRSGQNGCGTSDGTKRVYTQFQDSLLNIGASVNTGDFVLNTALAVAQFITTPTNPSNQKTAEFTVGGTDIVSYKFKLDGGNFSSEANVNTKIQLSDLTDASHTVSVVGKNNAGTFQAESSATTFTWLLDTTGPVLTITNDSGSPTNVVTPVLKLAIQDVGVGVTGAKMRFSCDNALWTNFEAFAATKNNFNVRSGNNGCSPADGSKTIFAQIKDSLENLGAAVQVALVLDTTPPIFLLHPSMPNPVKTKTWTWDTDDSTATFRFVIDQNANGVPTGNYGTAKTATQASGDGTFYLHLQAKDALANQTSVVTLSALLDNTAPTAVIKNPPASKTPKFFFSIEIGGEQVVSYRFKFDNGSLVPPLTNLPAPIGKVIFLTGVPVGDHTLEVIGIDMAGNVQTLQNSTRVSWTIMPLPKLIVPFIPVPPDAPPDTPPVFIPPQPVDPSLIPPLPPQMAKTNQQDVKFTIANDGEIAFYKYRVKTIALSAPPGSPSPAFFANAGGSGGGESDPFSQEFPVSAPISLSSLSEGARTLEYLGRSTSGTYPPESEATSFSWTVDVTPPTAAISGIPSTTSSESSVTATVSGTDVTHYRYSYNDGAFSNEATVATPIKLTSLTSGTHLLKVIGKDTAGNYQSESQATQARWVVAIAEQAQSVGGGGGGGGGGGSGGGGGGGASRAPATGFVGAQLQFKADQSEAARPKPKAKAGVSASSVPSSKASEQGKVLGAKVKREEPAARTKLMKSQSLKKEAIAIPAEKAVLPQEIKPATLKKITEKPGMNRFRKKKN